MHSEWYFGKMTVLTSAGRWLKLSYVRNTREKGQNEFQHEGEAET